MGLIVFGIQITDGSLKMKRSEMLKIIEKALNWPEGCSPIDVLDVVEEAGMLPPVQAPSLVPDTYNGHGMKHGPCQRVWDKEE